MSPRNLFLLGRRAGSEDQLTEMLAYLWERQPDLVGRWLESLPGLDAPVGPWIVATQVAEAGVGRFDLTLEAPGEAFIVVESKLEAELTAEQLSRYIDHAASRTEPLRVVASLTRHPPPRAPELFARADAAGVQLLQTRWQELASAIADAFTEGEAGDFVRMLIEEGLVVPDAITAEDLETWNRGAAVLARIKAVLVEARPGVCALSPGLRPSSRWGSDERWIYSGYASERIEVGVGFAANESPRRLDSPPIVFVYLRNLEVPASDVSERVRAALHAVPGATQVWSGYPTVSRPASEILLAADFRQQVEEVVAFVRQVLSLFTEVGYLPGVLVDVDRPVTGD